MRHFRQLQEVELPESWVAVGTFDGVHIGHRGILERMSREAHERGLPAVVVTFFPHPVVVLRGLEGPYYLTLPDERARYLGEAGIDVVVTLEFTREMAAWSARHFVQLLRAHLGMSELWAGPDFALGHNREGDLPALTLLGEELGYRVRVVPPFQHRGVVVSSSRVRALLMEGEVTEAAALLGRPYAISGPVAHGDSRGHTLGFPTANIDFWPQKIVPANGVYACRAWLQGQRYDAVTNVGVRPTFGTLPPLPRIEAYLLDFRREIYGQTLEVEFIRRLRGEQRFESVEALVGQIHRDIQITREVLQHES